MAFSSLGSLALSLTRGIFAAMVLFTPSLAGCADSQVPAGVRAAEPVVGLPCDGCDAVFDGLPESLTASARIAPKDMGERTNKAVTASTRFVRPVTRTPTSPPTCPCT